MCTYLLGENVDFSGTFAIGATVLFMPRHTNLQEQGLSPFRLVEVLMANAAFVLKC